MHYERLVYEKNVYIVVYKSSQNMARQKFKII